MRKVGLPSAAPIILSCQTAACSILSQLQRFGTPRGGKASRFSWPQSDEVPPARPKLTSPASADGSGLKGAPRSNSREVRSVTRHGAAPGIHPGAGQYARLLRTEAQSGSDCQPSNKVSALAPGQPACPDMEAGAERSRMRFARLARAARIRGSHLNGRTTGTVTTGYTIGTVLSTKKEQKPS